MEIENKPIKSVHFKDGQSIICIKGNCVMENNPNMRPYLNYVKDSIKKIEYKK